MTMTAEMMGPCEWAMVDCGEPYWAPAKYAPEDAAITERAFGYGVRMTMPGCLDSTDWEVFASAAEALRRALELELEEAA